MNLMKLVNADNDRKYLLVSTNEPHVAAVAVSAWEQGPPNFCVTSPSDGARTTAVFACAGRYVPMVGEPLLARRAPGESDVDFVERFAHALWAVLAYDARAGLVVCDELPSRWTTPLCVGEDELLRGSERLVSELPLP
jgi:hypothetical protein